MLRDLRLRDFRCFEQIAFRPNPGLNFLVGANAQGKTSVLEAICILLRLQSPKASSLAETVRFEQPAFSLDGHWEERHLRLKFERGLKAIALDSKTQSRSADYLAVARVSWIGNEDLQLVRGSGSTRRRYLDFLGTQVEPTYLKHLRAYERAMRSRNALLKDGRPAREIAAFDQPLSIAGEVLFSVRTRLVEELGPLVAKSYRCIAGSEELLQIRYIPGANMPWPEALMASRADEVRLRATVVGPHRDDLEILLEGKKASVYASEGQQRSASLALKLAQAELLATAGEPPIYLIDDIFGELDPVRRNNFMTSLPATAQKIVTTTSLSWMGQEPQGTIFQLSNGVLQLQ